MKIDIECTDIFSVDAEGIVNPANRQPTLWLGSHINEIIRKRGGKSVAVERKLKGPMKMGEAVATTAGNLPFKNIIHAAILDFYDFNPLFLLKLKKRTSSDTLRNGIRNALKTAYNLGLKSVVFSPMGAGIGGIGMEECSEIILGEMINFEIKGNEPTLSRLILCVQKKKDLITAQQVLAKLKAGRKN